jgi:hypothetical protein
MVLGGGLILASGLYIAVLASRTRAVNRDRAAGQILHDQPGSLL